MGLFKRKTGPAAAEVVLYLVGAEEVDFEVVGESYCKPQLQAIAKAASHEEREDGEVQTMAELVPHPDNQFDPRAIGVWIAGGRVGYIPRTATEDLHQVFAQGRARGGTRFLVPAVVGWNTENPDPPIGVRLGLPDDLSLVEPLTEAEVRAKSAAENA